MSFDVHEAFSFDSWKTHLLFWDDFEGDSLKDLWTNTLVGGGTGAVVDAQDGGIFRLGTPTASDESRLNWGNNPNEVRSLHIDKKVTIEARIRCNGGVTDTTRRILYLWYDADNFLGFYHGYDDSNIRLTSENNTVGGNTDSGIDVDTDYHIYRIECFPTDELHFYIDDTECANSPITTNIPDDAADYLMPYLRILTNSDTDPATSMDIDYVYVRQDR